MHSLREAFKAAGIVRPPISLRRLGEKLGHSPPISLRKAFGLPPAVPFPENGIELFKSYPLGTEDIIGNGEDNIGFVGALKKTKFEEFDLLDISRNKEARRLQAHRIFMVDMLEKLATPAGTIKTNTKTIRQHLFNRQAAKAENLINTQLPTKPIEIFNPEDPIWENAFRKDDVEGFVHNPANPSKPRRVKLRGYKGPTIDKDMIQKIVDVALFLQPESLERRFRENLLKAESIVGQRDFKEAVEAYHKLLREPGLSKNEKKFVALRQAATQNAWADQRFNALPPGDETERANVKFLYEDTELILINHGLTLNPLAQNLIAYAESQLALVNMGINALGSGTVISAVIDEKPEYFLNLARVYLELAKSTRNSFSNFLDKLDSEAEEQIEVEAKVEDAQTSLDELVNEFDVLNKQKEKLDKKKSFLNQMIGITEFMTAGFIIAAIAGAVEAGGGSDSLNAASGPGSSAMDGGFQLLEMFHQMDLIKIDEKILDLNENALNLRKFQAERQLRTVTILSAGNTVDIQKYLDLSNHYENLTLEAMRSALRMAYQAEVKLAFDRGTAFLPSEGVINPKILNHMSLERRDSGLTLDKYKKLEYDAYIRTLPDRFEKDQLNPLESEIGKTIQATGQPYTFFLTKLDLQAFLRFKQSGVTDFYISLYDTDKARPGGPNIRIVNVVIDLLNLGTLAGGIAVTLTHRGNFIVRDPQTILEAKTLEPDKFAFHQAAQAFSEGRNLSVKGVTFISARQNRRPFQFNGPPPQTTGTRQGLEGYGITGLWNIKINEQDLDDINLAQLTDVMLQFHTNVGEPTEDNENHINSLIREYEQKQEDSRDRISFFGMRDKFKSELNQIIDKPSHQAEIEINHNTTTIGGQFEQTLLKAIVLQVVNKDGGVPGVNLNLTVSRENIVHEFELETQAEGFTANLTEGTETREDIEGIEILEEGQRFPIGGPWTIMVPDVSTLKDDPTSNIFWYLIHEERPREN